MPVTPVLTVCTFGGLNLNDRTNYFLMSGFDPGAPVITFDVYRSYTGAVKQYNVTEANLIEMAVPLRIVGSSEYDLQVKVAALNAIIDNGASTLVHGPTGNTTSYSVVYSPQVSYPRTEAVRLHATAFITFKPWRTP
jgi:hypothetical protein